MGVSVAGQSYSVSENTYHAVIINGLNGKHSGAESGDLDGSKDDKKDILFPSAPCRLGCSAWCRKYFWEGMLL